MRSIKQFKQELSNELPGCSIKVGKPEVDEGTGLRGSPFEIHNSDNQGVKILVTPSILKYDEGARLVGRMVSGAFKNYETFAN